MKRLIYLFTALLLLASCQQEQLPHEGVAGSDKLSATMEQLVMSRTSMDEKNNVLWSEDDQIVSFFKTTRGQKYQVTSASVGRNTADFVKVTESESGDGLFSGMEIDHIVALYPYSSSVDCSMNGDDSYKLDFSLPQTQYYSESSFGNGAFPMLAVSADNDLIFKNICGGLKLQFKGVDKIKSITLEGLVDETLSGSAAVVGYVDGSAPEITMSSSAAKSVTLDCGDGVQLYEDQATTFIIILPPMTFKSGMKLTVTDTDGLSRTLTNSSFNTVKRSSLLTFPVITYKQDGVLEFPEGAVTSFELPAEGGTVEIAVMTNQGYEVVIPDEAKDWISLVETRALREELIKLSVSENLTPEVRFAEVLIATASGHITQTISLSQEKANQVSQLGDYVDEYGINHGQGLNYGKWAPVNCGYKAPVVDEAGNVIEKGYPSGKSYQYGRRWGFGTSDKDSHVSEISSEAVTLDVAQSELYSDVILNASEYIIGGYENLWNLGTDEEPIKSEYDPCPDGWRVPTYSELKSLARNDVGWWTNSTLGTKGFSLYFNDGTAIYIDRPCRSSEARYVLRGWYRDYVTMDGSSFSKQSTLGLRCRRDEKGLIPVSEVSFPMETIELNIGDTYPFEVTILPSNANHQRAYWYSDDSSIITFDKGEIATAIAEGTTIVTAIVGLKTAKCTVTVKGQLSESSYTDLSATGTANSYIVSEAGSYKFTPTKGNSGESVGEISSAEVLWETFGTDVTPNKGDLVKNVMYKDGTVYFETPSEYKEGNAVIAAKDASGTILWSWHIWVTDEPEGQVYYNNAGTMMDRNLGATSATPGDVGALGLLYQWGRKDPLLGSSSIKESTQAKSTITWPSAVSSDSSNGTIAYATANPATFINGNGSNYDWYYTGSSSTDNTRWTTSPTQKSIYDPCPAGWRVPDGGKTGVWNNASNVSANTFDNINKGMNFYGIYSSSHVNIWYPATGSIHLNKGELGYVGTSGGCWSASPDIYTSYNAYRLHYTIGGSVAPMISEGRANGLALRCIKE